LWLGKGAAHCCPIETLSSTHQAGIDKQASTKEKSQPRQQRQNEPAWQANEWGAERRRDLKNGVSQVVVAVTARREWACARK